MQCGHNGHREYFCPVNPLSRQAFHDHANAQADLEVDTTLQRPSDLGASDRVNAAGGIDPLRAGQYNLAFDVT